MGVKPYKIHNRQFGRYIFAGLLGESTCLYMDLGVRRVYQNKLSLKHQIYSVFRINFEILNAGLLWIDDHPFITIKQMTTLTTELLKPVTEDLAEN